MPKPVRHPTVEHTQRSYSRNVRGLSLGSRSQDYYASFKEAVSPANKSRRAYRWVFFVLIISALLVAATDAIGALALLFLAFFPSFLLWLILIGTNGDSIRNRYSHCFLLGSGFIACYAFFHPIVALYLMISLSGIFFIYHRFDRDELVRGLLIIFAVGGIFSAIITAIRFTMRFNGHLL